MTTADILTLAKAGFSAQQIAGLAALVQAPAPAPAQAPVPGQLNIAQLAAAANLQLAAQPPVQSCDEILAEIINPPKAQ